MPIPIKVKTTKINMQTIKPYENEYVGLLVEYSSSVYFNY